MHSSENTPFHALLLQTPKKLIHFFKLTALFALRIQKQSLNVERYTYTIIKANSA